jgi:hypothetical protein
MSKYLRVRAKTETTHKSIKKVNQIFHSQVKQPIVEIKMNNSKLETVSSFK